MGIRDVLQRKKNLTLAMAIGLLVLGVGAIIWQLMASHSDTRRQVPNDFFTIDDGQTWFRDKATNLPPFDRDGKQAVKAWVYQCGGKQFVGYLERYTPEARQVLAAKPPPAPTPTPGGAKGKTPEAAVRASASPAAAMNASMNGKEYKRPGEKEWTRITERRKIAEMMFVKCPDGGSATAVMP